MNKNFKVGYSMLSDFDYPLFEAVRIASKKNPPNEEILEELTTIIIEILSHGFDTENHDILNSYRNLPIRTYYLLQNSPSIGEKTINSYIDFFVSRFHITWFKNNHEEFVSYKSEAKILRYTYAFFFDFFREILIDPNKTDEYIEQLLDKLIKSSSYDLFQSKSILLGKLKNVSTVQKLDLINEFRNDNVLSITHRHALLAVISWSFLLYQVNIITKERLLKVIQKLNIYHDINDMVFDVLTIIKEEHSGYLGLNTWEYRKKDVEDISTPLAVRLWILYGLMDLLKNNIINHQEINYDFIPNDEQFRFIYDDVKRILNGIRKSSKKWINVFNITDETSITKAEKFENRLRKIENIFGTLKARTELLRDKEISEQPIDQNKIDGFISMLAKTWKENVTSYAVFDALKNIKISTTKEGLKEQPKYGTRYHFLERFRMAFIEKHGQEIYGVGDIALWSARQTDNSFLFEVFEKKKNDVKHVSAVESIDSAINRLNINGYLPNLIIVPPEFSYKTDLSTSPNYTHAWKIESEETLANTGMYKNLPVLSLYAPLLRNQIIVCQFEKAFELEIYENENLKFNRLHLLLRAVTEDEIERKFNEESKWKTDEATGITLTEVEAKTRIRNTMVLEIMSFANFNIIDENAYEVAIIDVEPD